MSAWIVIRLRRNWTPTPHATNYIEAVQQHEGAIPFAPTLWRTLSSAFSVATGAAVGREGSMIQFAAAATSWAGRTWQIRTSPPNHPFTLARQVACGAAAAVSTAYQAPLAGIFFASEIVLDTATPADYPLLAIASLAGWLTSRPLLGHGPLFNAPAPLPALSLQWAWLLPLALLLGAVAPAYQALIRSLRFAGDWPLALVWGGLATGLLSLISPEVWGNGDAALLALVHTRPGSTLSVSAVALVLALRLAATVVCVGVGTIGGVFTPTLYVGAAAGLLFAYAIHAASPLLFILIGIGALLSAVTHAPIMATLMTVELTGKWQLLPVVLLANLIAWQIASRLTPNSLYGIATTTPGHRPDPCLLGQK